jgi:acyl-CoA oxidase
LRSGCARRGLLLEIRKQAVPLTDAFDLPDFLVNSPLGKSDGDIYNAYMQARSRTTAPPPPDISLL